jgi:hypothetical protein
MNTGLNFCRKCGGSLTGRTKFCGHCGTLIMSTAIAPTPKRAYVRTGMLAAGVGAILIGVQLHRHPTHLLALTRPTSPPFLEPGPPADLITMLQRGFTLSENDPLPIEGAASVMKDLCHVILTDYPSSTYGYGPTTDAARQAQVEGEAESLVEQVSTLFADKATARHNAEVALAGQAIQLYDQRQLDPGQACQMIKPVLDHPMF